MQVNDSMTLGETVLVGFGLCCVAVLVVLGAMAWVRDWRADRLTRQRLAEIVDQVRQGIAAEGGEWTQRQQ